MAALTMCPSEGYVLPLTTLHLDLAGRVLMKVFTELGYFFITIGEGWGG